MKNLVPWLKSNLISVIAIAVALIAAPVMLFFAGRMSGKVRADVEAEVAQAISQLEQSDVTYEIQPYLSGLEPVSVKSAPNEATTEAVAALLRSVVEGAGKVRQAAIDFNSRGKTLLVDGSEPAERLFPENTDTSARLKLLDRMVARFPQAHEELLRSKRGGSPPSAERIRTALLEVFNKEIARRTTGRTERDLTPEDRAELTKLLGERRMALYRGESGELSFYAAPSAFTRVTPWDPAQPLPIEVAWEWQHLYWIHADIIEAVAAANSDDVGAWLPVHRAPVKIVESVRVLVPGEEVTRGPGQQQAPAAASAGGPTDGAAEVPRSFAVAHTGRAAAPNAANPLYDIRYVDVSLIVSSSRLPTVLSAFSRVNFMTVVDVDLEEFDPFPFIARGYDLGSDHLVRAKLRVETIWLRSWMKKWMPPTVRRSLGIPDDPPPGTPAADGQTPADAGAQTGDSAPSE
ncbi:MAG: hypothetical protein SFZ24_08095 [Planctomycetota bacterium]|nr:hypothetical protein [Planctomycetota bacterium]